MFNRPLNRLAKVAVLGSALFFLGLAGSGCGAKEYFNCRTICNKEKQCHSDTNFDTCVDKCSDKANTSDEQQRKVNSCSECIEPLSCDDYTKYAGCASVCQGTT